MASDPVVGTEPQELGRYRLIGTIAAGGMSTIYRAELAGATGAMKTVAIKRMHPHLADNRELVASFLDEVRITSCIKHPNVVATSELVREGGELFFVLDYLEGKTLAALLEGARERKAPVPLGVGAAVVLDMLRGLHAAHEARGLGGKALDVVHRDVCPQHVIVGADGVSRVLDFGAARWSGRAASSSEGDTSTSAYMAPEQARGTSVDRRTDVYACATVLWEMLVGRRMVPGKSVVETFDAVVRGEVVDPSTVEPRIPAALAAAIVRGIADDIEKRWPTAKDFATAIEQAVIVSSPKEVAAWVESLPAAPLPPTVPPPPGAAAAAIAAAAAAAAASPAKDLSTNERVTANARVTPTPKPPPTTTTTTTTTTAKAALTPARAAPSVKQPSATTAPGIGPPDVAAPRPSAAVRAAPVAREIAAPTVTSSAKLRATAPAPPPKAEPAPAPPPKAEPAPAPPPKAEPAPAPPPKAEPAPAPPPKAEPALPLQPFPPSPSAPIIAAAAASAPEPPEPEPTWPPVMPDPASLDRSTLEPSSLEHPPPERPSIDELHSPIDELLATSLAEAAPPAEPEMAASVQAPPATESGDLDALPPVVPTKLPLRLIGGIAAIVAVVLVLVLVTRRGPAPRPTPATAVSAAAATSSAPVAPATSAPAEPPPPPTARAPEEPVVPDPSLKPPPAKPAPKPAGSTPAPVGPAPATSKPKPRPKKSCSDDPFFIGPDGLKRVRPECMK